MAGGNSFSPSISLKSISILRLICVIGMSLAEPSNGFSVLSPICSNTKNIQPTKILNGTANQINQSPNFTVCLDNSPMKPKGIKKQSTFVKYRLILENCRG